MKLIVLSSHADGLLNVILEAMAGAVPDVINGKTRFIMENNSPECIAENVIRAMEHPDIEPIANAGRRFVDLKRRREIEGCSQGY